MLWEILYGLGRDEMAGPDGCFVFTCQQANLPKGFLYTSPSDYFSNEGIIQARLGFSVQHPQFVVFVPFDQRRRFARIAAGIHTLLWPLGLLCSANHKHLARNTGGNSRATA